MAVYGTKDSPDSNSRAAISLAPTVAPTLPSTVQPPTPRVMEKELTRLQQPSTSAATVSASGDWLDKSTVHQNNLEQNARASSLPNGGHLLEPVTVLSSSSGGARAGCRPGHWDSASAVCLSTCLALVITSLLVSDDRLIPWTRLFR